MSVESVREYLRRFGRDGDILETADSSATVELAAAALGVEPARIAKTLSFGRDGNTLLVVAAGDARMDNKKFKQRFGFKASMLSADRVEEATGHPVGGVCPFAVKDGVPIYLDVSLKRFTTVFPACGSGNSMIEVTCADLEHLSAAAGWVDVCKGWDDND